MQKNNVFMFGIKIRFNIDLKTNQEIPAKVPTHISKLNNLLLRSQSPNPLQFTQTIAASLCGWL